MPVSEEVRRLVLRRRACRLLRRSLRIQVSQSDLSIIQVVRCTHITLRVNLHLRHGIIEFHILLPDSAAVLDRHNLLLQSI
jgi:hypothetical protein